MPVVKHARRLPISDTEAVARARPCPGSCKGAARQPTTNIPWYSEGHLLQVLKENEHCLETQDSLQSFPKARNPGPTSLFLAIN